MALTVMKPSVQTDFAFMESLKKINQVYLWAGTVRQVPHQKLTTKVL